MNILDLLHDILETEMADQMLYNQYMLQVTTPAIRQLFTQFRDEHMQNISQIQQQIKEWMKND
jgi:hypothetical protein